MQQGEYCASVTLLTQRFTGQAEYYHVVFKFSIDKPLTRETVTMDVKATAIYMVKEKAAHDNVPFSSDVAFIPVMLNFDLN
jgi:hypothetical protein